MAIYRRILLSRWIIVYKVIKENMVDRFCSRRMWFKWFRSELSEAKITFSCFSRKRLNREERWVNYINWGEKITDFVKAEGALILIKSSIEIRSSKKSIR